LIGLWSDSRILTFLPEACFFFFLRVLGSPLDLLNYEAVFGDFEYLLGDSL